MSAADHVFDRYSTVTRPLLDRYVRYTPVRALGAAITPLCFYVLGAFLPSVPGRARDADHRIKTPPVLSFSTYLFPIPEMGAPQDFILNIHEQMTYATSH